MRVPGTPEARKAWLILRGPFFAAYLTLVAIACSIEPLTTVGWVWKMGLIATASLAALGSFASWLIAGRGKRAPWLPKMEALEVTALRMMVALQIIYAASIAFILRPSYGYVLLNLGIGLFALGILLNMTWHKGKVGR